MGDFQSAPREKQNVALLVSPLVAQLKKFREDFQATGSLLVCFQVR
jgi:hypothetical protein